MIDIDTNASRLGTESITKLIPKFAIPGIIGLVVVSLYNIIDRIFIGHGVGPMAISGLALTMPISNMVAAIGTLIGVGAAARTSIVLGRGDYNWARNILAHVPMLSIALSSVFIILSLLFLDELLLMFGGSEQTLPYAKEYLSIVIPASIFTNICFSLSSVIRGSGHPNKSMYVVLLGVVLNIILDPIFIIWFDMGIRGAAIATAISMFFGAVYAVSHFIGREKPLSFHIENFRLKGHIIKNIISIGMSPFAMNFAASFVALILNNQLKQYGGDLAIGAFGIINSYLMLSVMMVLGFCQGTQPIIGYNYGQGNMKRVKDTFFITLKITSLVCFGGFLIIQFFPRYLAYAFVGNEPQMVDIVIRGLHLCSICLPLVATQIVIAQYFMAVSKAKLSIVMSLSRQVLFLIPFIIILPNFWGLDGVWLSIPFADFIAAVIGIIFINREKKRIYGDSKISVFRKNS